MFTAFVVKAQNDKDYKEETIEFIKLKPVREML